MKVEIFQQKILDEMKKKHIDFLNYTFIPPSSRMLEAIQDDMNLYLGGLKARGIISDGRVEILMPENPTTDLADGIIRFHIYITPPSPAREIDFIVEYDPDYLATLFE